LREDTMNRGQQLTLFGAFGLLVGAFLPWATIASPLLGLSLSKAGYEGDGLFTGGVGLLLLLGSVISKGKPGRLYSIAGVVFSVLAGAILFMDLSSVRGVVSDVGEDVIASVGPGVYVSIVGALLALVGGLQRVPSPPAQPSTSMQGPASPA
jgi:hypothetical protein